jgi:hypothetical protein
MPTLKDLEHQVRRRSLGRTFGEICLDLAVVPGFCTSAFWNQLFEIMRYLGGSVATVMREKTRRQDAFAQEQDRKLDSTWDWRDPKRDAVHQILGFFIGETPVDPFAQSPAPGLHAAPRPPTYHYARGGGGNTAHASPPTVETRLALAMGWPGPGTFVFCQADGSPLSPDRLSQQLQRKADAMGLPQCRCQSGIQPPVLFPSTPC